jgi:hypothetical protein
LSVRTRVKTLERHWRPVSKPPFRLIMSRAGEPFDRATATCQRTLSSNGTLSEIVTFGGCGDELTGDELERFIASFPIEAGPRW